jgi:hypothetical protein
MHEFGVASFPPPWHKRAGLEIERHHEDVVSWPSYIIARSGRGRLER